MGRLIRPKVVHYAVPVHAAHPVSVGMISRLSALYARGINGNTGTIRYGYPQIGSREKFAGYAFPPQMFTGWNPRLAGAGTVRPTPGQLPGSQAPYANTSPLLGQMLALTGPGDLGVLRRG
jgi:hypothetical protein